jgi:hypothetical protein
MRDDDHLDAHRSDPNNQRTRLAVKVDRFGLALVAS